MQAVEGIPIVIAAGGDGNRIGGDKPLCLLGGKRLIDHALDLAHSQSRDVAVAVRRQTRLELPDTVERLDDAEANGGPLSALASALAYGKDRNVQKVLLIGCDMPFLPADLLTTLGTRHDANLVALAESGGRLHPACALWPVAAQEALSDYAIRGRRSLIGFAERIGYHAVAWPVAPVDAFFNINTPEDLAMAETHFGQKDSA